MKPLIVTGLAILVIGGLFYFAPQERMVFEREIVTEEVIKEVPTLDIRIEKAQAEARKEIEQKAQEAYDAFVKKEMKRIEDEVKIEYISEIEKSIEDVVY
jgi:hypothetical protein